MRAVARSVPLTRGLAPKDWRVCYCQNSHSVKPEEPAPLHRTLFTSICLRLALYETHDTHKTVLQYSYTSRFSEVRSAKFYGGREELLTILSRCKVDPGPHNLYHLVPHPVCLSFTSTTSLPPRNPHHAVLPSMYGSTRCKPCLNNPVYHRVGYRTGLRNRRANVI